MKTSQTILITLLALSTACTADLRPDSIETGPTRAAETKGRDLLAAAAIAHGAEAYETRETYEFVMHDHWQGFLGRVGNPWPEHDLRVRMQLKTRSFDTRAKFMDGEKEGSTWGLQAWNTYEVNAQGQTTFVENDDAKFILAAVHYFTEFPFRIQKADRVAYTGKRTVNGKRYETVFATWRSYQPSSDFDQYMIYINPETALIEKVEYTVREFADFASGAIHYEDIREVDGVKVAFHMPVTEAIDDDLDDYLHDMRIESFQTNSFATSRFEVNPKLMAIGDSK